MVRNAADSICLNAHLFQAVGGFIHALKIIPMTRSSFPCHKAWLVSSGHRLLLSTPPTSLGLQYIHFPRPYAFCLLSQPDLALFLLILTFTLSQDPKSVLVRPQVTHTQQGPRSTLQGMGAAGAMVGDNVQLLVHIA